MGPSRCILWNGQPPSRPFAWFPGIWCQFVEQPFDLGVLVGEQPALQQRIVRMIDPRDEMARTERDLLRLGQEVVGIAVQHKLADDPNGQDLLRYDLRSAAG